MKEFFFLYVFFVQTNHTRKELLFLMFLKINLRNHSSLHKLFYSLNLMPLKYFVDVVETYGFISAAKRNYVSETAVSSAISKLEKEIGHKLINRSAGQFSLTPYGEALYQRTTTLLYSYEEIWHHADQNPSKIIRIHFLEGLAGGAAELAEKLSGKNTLTFDQEELATSINRLLQNDYDILVGFQLAFMNNAKIIYHPLRKISFQLLFNRNELQNKTPKQLAEQSTLYLQYWQATGIWDIQTKMIEQYQQDGWTFKNIEGVNSFSAAALNVNFKGGIAMIPETFKLPDNCHNLSIVSPHHLKNNFEIGVAIRKGNKAMDSLIKKAIS